MSRLEPEDFAELRPIIEDADMRLDATDPERLVMELVDGFEIDWSLTIMIDSMLDAIETHEGMDDALHMAAYFEAQAKRIRRTLNDMEGS